MSRTDSAQAPLRPYQRRICDSASSQNALVVLPTGAGKTRIASEVASLCLNRNSSKVVLFLVPTCLLVKQQSDSIRSTTGRKVSEYMGGASDPTDCDILVSTPAAYSGLSIKSPTRFGLVCLSLIVFDEVHHVVKRHPYRKIARLLALIPLKAPQILGLTASLTYAVGEGRIRTAVEELCNELSIVNVYTATTEELKAGGYHAGEAAPQLGPSITSALSDDLSDGDSDDDVDLDISQDPTGMPPPLPGKVHEALPDFLKAVSTRSALLHPLVHALMDAVRDTEARVKRLDPSFMSPIGKSGKAGRVAEWGEYANKQASKRRSADELRVAYELLENLYEATRLVVSSRQTAVELSMQYLEMMGVIRVQQSTGHTSVDALIRMWNEKKNEFCRLRHLKEVLVEQKGKFSHGLRCIVFSQQRVTTHILKHFVDHDPHLRDLHSDVIYATSSPATARLSVSSSQARVRLEQFAAGELSLLFSTAVAEEGMDVPAANCVIRFDPIQTPVSLVQSRGRARQESSAFIVLQEQKGRTVADLAVAEHQQSHVLKSIDLGSEQQHEAARERRDQAHQSRQRNGLSKLREQIVARGAGTTPNDVSLVKLFAQWTATELDVQYKKRGVGWVGHMKLLQPWKPDGGMAAEAFCNTKKEAAAAAAVVLLAKLNTLL
eukprot:gene4885-9740_t